MLINGVYDGLNFRCFFVVLPKNLTLLIEFDIIFWGGRKRKQSERVHERERARMRCSLLRCLTIAYTFEHAKSCITLHKMHIIPLINRRIMPMNHTVCNNNDSGIFYFHSKVRQAAYQRGRSFICLRSICSKAHVCSAVHIIQLTNGTGPRRIIQSGFFRCRNK